MHLYFRMKTVLISKYKPLVIIHHDMFNGNKGLKIIRATVLSAVRQTEIKSSIISRYFDLHTFVTSKRGWPIYHFRSLQSFELTGNGN